MSNSLRVPFVNKIFPEAKFIHIVRDGRDVTLSAARRWVAPVDYKYLLRKLRHVPSREIPNSLMQFVNRRASKLLSKNGSLPSWGPRIPAMLDFVEQHSLEESCAKQWASCVARSEEDLSRIPKSRVINVKFEDLVTMPRETLARIGSWYGEDLNMQVDSQIIAKLVSARAQSWKAQAVEFSPLTLSILEAGLKSNGYH